MAPVLVSRNPPPRQIDSSTRCILRWHSVPVPVLRMPFHGAQVALSQMAGYRGCSWPSAFDLEHTLRSQRQRDDGDVIVTTAEERLVVGVPPNTMLTPLV